MPTETLDHNSSTLSRMKTQWRGCQKKSIGREKEEKKKNWALKWSKCGFVVLITIGLLKLQTCCNILICHLTSKGTYYEDLWYSVGFYRSRIYYWVHYCEPFNLVNPCDTSPVAPSSTFYDRCLNFFIEIYIYILRSSSGMSADLDPSRSGCFGPVWDGSSGLVKASAHQLLLRQHPLLSLKGCLLCCCDTSSSVHGSGCVLSLWNTLLCRLWRK